MAKYKRNPFVDDHAEEGNPSCSDDDSESLGSARQNDTDQVSDDLRDFIDEDDESEHVPSKAIKPRRVIKEAIKHIRGDKKQQKQQKQQKPKKRAHESPEEEDSDADSYSTAQEKEGKMNRSRVLDSEPEDVEEQLAAMDNDDAEGSDAEGSDAEGTDGEEQEEDADDSNPAALLHEQELEDDDVDVAEIRKRLVAHKRSAAISDIDHEALADQGLSDESVSQVPRAFARASSNARTGSATSGTFTPQVKTGKSRPWIVGSRFSCREPVVKGKARGPLLQWEIRYHAPVEFQCNRNGMIDATQVTCEDFSTCVEVSSDTGDHEEHLECFLIPAHAGDSHPAPVFVDLAMAKSLHDRMTRAKRLAFRAQVFKNNNRVTLDNGNDGNVRLMTCPAYYDKISKDHQRSLQKTLSRQVKTRMQVLKDKHNIELPSEPLRDSMMHLFKFWLAQNRTKPNNEWLLPFNQFHAFGAKQLPRLMAASTPESVRAILADDDFKVLRPLISSLMYMLPSIGGEEFRQALALELAERDDKPGKKSSVKRAKTAA